MSRQKTVAELRESAYKNLESQNFVGMDNREICVQMYMRGYTLGYYDCKPKRRKINIG